jgi:WD40 repeat protein
VLHINPQCSNDISCLFLLQDKRLAIGSLDQSITICSLDIETKSYTIDIKKDKAHDNEINSICQFTDRDDILVSSSDDNQIKLWQLQQYEMNFIRVFDKHSDYVFKLIPLTNTRCASCSLDRTVKIWRASVDAPTELASLAMRSEVRCILQLRSGNEELVASCGDESIWFWNVSNDTYQHVSTINGYYALEPYHMIELPGMRLAVSSDTNEHPIVVIDTLRYEVVKVIDMREYNVQMSSSLCMVDGLSSFIYARDTKLIRFDAKTYDVIDNVDDLEKVDGDWDIVAIDDGKCFAIGNVSKGVTVFNNVIA